MKVSFDADGCLLHLPKVQAIARAHQANWDELYLLTYRDRRWDDNDALEALCDELKIPVANRLYAAGSDKVSECAAHGIDVHYDDDLLEVHRINTAGNGTMAVCVNYTNERSNLYDHTGLDEDITLISGS
jgi:hypothetical protein